PRPHRSDEGGPGQRGLRADDVRARLRRPHADGERRRGRGRTGRLRRALVREVLAVIERMVADAVDRIKTTADPIPVVVVGGGSVLLPDELPGASRLV